MKMLLTIAVVGLVLVAVVGTALGQRPVGPRPAPLPPVDPKVRDVAERNNAFALDLYAELRGQKGNLFLSPFSISTALAMTCAGARGETAAQMGEVLHLQAPPEELHPAYKKLIEDLNARAEKAAYQLVVANALWGQKGYGFLGDYLQLTKDSYGAGLNEVDFVGDTEGARQTINKWVEQATRDKIKDLIARGVLNDMTRLVLTNAIYFLGTWEKQFEKEATQDQPFTLADGTQVNVPLMSQGGRFPYMETDAFQALEIPYKGRDLSMVILLPRSADGLPALEKELTFEKLGEWLGALKVREGHVWVPRFKMTYTITLSDVLKKMGMTDAFTPDVADLSGMNGKRDLYVSEVVHKAFVDVNEEGTEAAAATAVVVAMTSAPVREEPFEFRADRPFMFLIRDRRTESLLFLGRVMDPTK